MFQCSRAPVRNPLISVTGGVIITQFHSVKQNVVATSHGFAPAKQIDVSMFSGTCSKSPDFGNGWGYYNIFTGFISTTRPIVFKNFFFSIFCALFVHNLIKFSKFLHLIITRHRYFPFSLLKGQRAGPKT